MYPILKSVFMFQSFIAMKKLREQENKGEVVFFWFYEKISCFLVGDIDGGRLCDLGRQ